MLATASFRLANVVKVLTSPSNVPLFVVAKALYSYVISVSKPSMVSVMCSPIVEFSVIHCSDDVALYLKPCDVISSLPANMSALISALECVIFVAGRVIIVGETTSSDSVVKVVDVHGEVWVSHIALTSTVYSVPGVRSVSVSLVVMSVSTAPPFTFISYESAVPSQLISAEVSVILFAERLVGASQGEDASSVAK